MEVAQPEELLALAYLVAKAGLPRAAVFQADLQIWVEVQAFVDA